MSQAWEKSFMDVFYILNSYIDPLIDIPVLKSQLNNKLIGFEGNVLSKIILRSSRRPKPKF